MHRLAGGHHQRAATRCGTSPRLLQPRPHIEAAHTAAWRWTAATRPSCACQRRPVPLRARSFGRWDGKATTRPVAPGATSAAAPRGRGRRVARNEARRAVRHLTPPSVAWRSSPPRRCLSARAACAGAGVPNLAARRLVPVRDLRHAGPAHAARRSPPALVPALPVPHRRLSAHHRRRRRAQESADGPPSCAAPISPAAGPSRPAGRIRRRRRVDRGRGPPRARRRPDSRSGGSAHSWAAYSDRHFVRGFRASSRSSSASTYIARWRTGALRGRPTTRGRRRVGAGRAAPGRAPAHRLA